MTNYLFTYFYDVRCCSLVLMHGDRSVISIELVGSQRIRPRDVTVMTSSSKRGFDCLISQSLDFPLPLPIVLYLPTTNAWYALDLPAQFIITDTSTPGSCPSPPIRTDHKACSISSMSVVAKHPRYHPRLFTTTLMTSSSIMMIKGSFAFFLAPLALPDETSEILIYDVSLVVYNQDQKPVLFAMIKTDRGATTVHASTHQWADCRMRQRYEEILYDCPIPHLYGLCLFGTFLRVYCEDKDTGRITPDFVGHDSRKFWLPNDFLEGEWDLDILSLGRIEEDAGDCCIYQGRSG